MDWRFPEMQSSPETPHGPIHASTYQSEGRGLGRGRGRGLDRAGCTPGGDTPPTGPNVTSPHTQIGARGNGALAIDQAPLVRQIPRVDVLTCALLLAPGRVHLRKTSIGAILCQSCAPRVGAYALDYSFDLPE